MLPPVYGVRVPKGQKIGPFGTFIENDPTINQLQENLLKKIQEILPKEPEPEVVNNSSVKIISVEDAIKELLAMSKR